MTDLQRLLFRPNARSPRVLGLKRSNVMSLPILKVTSAPTTETLIRYLHQTESKWTEHLSEIAVLDFGTAWTNPQLSRVFIANRMLDVSLPPGVSPKDAMAQADEHFAQRGVTCMQWVMNPSAAAEQTQPMVEYLLSNGFERGIADIMYLDRVNTLPAGSTDELKIIPARASFRHS